LAVGQPAPEGQADLLQPEAAAPTGASSENAGASTDAPPQEAPAEQVTEVPVQAAAEETTKLPSAADEQQEPAAAVA